MAAQQNRVRRETQIQDSGGADPEIPELRKVTPEELAEHTEEKDMWCAFHGLVYDVTNWVAKHPGGKTVLKSCAGGDGTSIFETVHGGRGALILLGQELGKQVELIGEFDAPTVEEVISGTVEKEYFNQESEVHSFTLKGGAVDIDETCEVGKANVSKVTTQGPTSALWVSAQFASDEADLARGVKEQADVAINQMRDHLEKANAKLHDVVKLNIYIKRDKDEEKWEEKQADVARAMNAACEAWACPYDLLKPSARSKRHDPKDGPAPGPPAVTWMGTPALANPKALVAFEAVAMVPAQPISSKL